VCLVVGGEDEKSLSFEFPYSSPVGRGTFSTI